MTDPTRERVAVLTWPEGAPPCAALPPMDGVEWIDGWMAGETVADGVIVLASQQLRVVGQEAELRRRVTDLVPSGWRLIVAPRLDGEEDVPDGFDATVHPDQVHTLLPHLIGPLGRLHRRSRKAAMAVRSALGSWTHDTSSPVQGFRMLARQQELEWQSSGEAGASVPDPLRAEMRETAEMLVALSAHLDLRMNYMHGFVFEPSPSTDTVDLGGVVAEAFRHPYTQGVTYGRGVRLDTRPGILVCGGPDIFRIMVDLVVLGPVFRGSWTVRVWAEEGYGRLRVESFKEGADPDSLAPASLDLERCDLVRRGRRRVASFGLHNVARRVKALRGSLHYQEGELDSNFVCYVIDIALPLAPTPSTA